MRIDQKIAEEWIQPRSRMLDLGCGDGTFLAQMQQKYQVHGYGLEIDQDRIAVAIGRGLNIIQQDLNLGLSRFDDQSFDTVIMTQALQAVDAPHILLNDMVRVGKQVIITFPNFAHWRTRVFLGFKGEMPMSDALPYMWYNTPNIHLCTFRDFEALCAENNIKILNRLAVNDNQQGNILSKCLPNLFGEVAIYRVSKLP